MMLNLTLCILMNSSFCFVTMSPKWSIVLFKGPQITIFELRHTSVPEIVFIYANSADPDEMLHYAAFHLGPHCLPKYLLRGFQYKRIKDQDTTLT